MKKVGGDAPSFVRRVDDLNEFLVKLCGVALAVPSQRDGTARDAAALESATNALIHPVGARGRYPKLVARHAGQRVQH